MPMTTFLSNKLLDHVFRNVTYTPPATVYIGLFTVAPTIAGGGTEVTGGSYARAAVTVSAASAQATSNSGIVAHPPATAGWGTPVAGAMFDAPTGGNMLEFAAIPVGQQNAVLSGQTFKWQAGQIAFLFT
jgi:hypothetical protein